MSLPPPPRFEPDPWATSRTIVIGLGGGSGSGKTTIAEALVDAIAGVAYFRHDDYYRHRPELTFEDRTKVNYDHPDSLETALLVSHLETLRSGQPIERPVYDFTTHLRSDETVLVAPAPVVVVEGILVLADADLRRMLDLKIYVDTDADLRLTRRMERDISERGRTAESVLTQYLTTVRPMHLEFVEPSKKHADMIIPGGFRVGAVATVIEMIRGRFSGA
ncbi:MAG: uridine kinase [Acidimicrobiia bacterium]